MTRQAADGPVHFYTFHTFLKEICLPDYAASLAEHRQLQKQEIHSTFPYPWEGSTLSIEKGPGDRQ